MLMNLVQSEEGLTLAETCSCKYDFNKEVLSLADIYWSL